MHWIPQNLVIYIVSECNFLWSSIYLGRRCSFVHHEKVLSIFSTLFELLPPLSASRNPPRIPLWRFCQLAYAWWKPRPPQSCTMWCDWNSSGWGQAVSPDPGPLLKKLDVSQRTLCSNRWLDLLYFRSICVSACSKKQVKEMLMYCR